MPQGQSTAGGRKIKGTLPKRGQASRAGRSDGLCRPGSCAAMSSRRWEVPRRIAAGTGRHMSGCARLWRDAGRADRGRGQDVLRFLRGKKLVLLSMPVSIIYCVCLGGRGTPRSAVDVRKAPASPNGHGPPGRLSVAAGAGGPSLFAAKREKAFLSSFPPSPPSLPPRAFTRERQGYEASPPQKASGARSVCLPYMLNYLQNLLY